jgi:Phage terminase large subunit (GpA)
MVDVLKEMRRRALSALVPPPTMPLSAWLEASVILPEGLCAVPGKMRLYPYQREIADAIADPEIERVTLQKAARIGFSVLVAAAIGHYCGNDPAPVLCLATHRIGLARLHDVGHRANVRGVTRASRRFAGRTHRPTRPARAQHDIVAPFSGGLAQDRRGEEPEEPAPPYAASDMRVFEVPAHHARIQKS